MSQDTFTQSVAQSSTLATNKLIRNTYNLLAMTLVFSALMAFVSVKMAPAPMIGIVCSLIGMGLIWLVLPRMARSAAGVPLVFAITGLFGFGLGPLLNAVLSFANGSQIISLAMGGTGVIFFALSAYALISRRNFNFMAGFLLVGIITVIVASLANIFLQIPVLSITISAAVILLMSGYILFDTSRMIHNPEQSNYLFMTVSLFLNILNIFTSLIQILAAVDRD